jgi:hypothetical protein
MIKTELSLKKMSLEELGPPPLEKPDKRPQKFKDCLPQKEDVEEDSLRPEKKLYMLTPPKPLVNIKL